MKKIMSIILSVATIPVYHVLRCSYFIFKTVKFVLKKVIGEPYMAMRDYFDHRLGLAKKL